MSYPLCYTNRMMKMKKQIEWTSYNAMQRKLNRDADKYRMEKHIWYGEMFIAACLGAALALTIASLV